MTFKNQGSTMTKFALQLENNASDEDKTKNYLRWNTTLNRWKKEVFSQADHLKKGNMPPYGKEIDDELLDVAKNYNKHGVPMNDYILRCCLIEIITKKTPKYDPKNCQPS